MHPNFPDWHRLVDIEPDADKIDLHWQAIEDYLDGSTEPKLLQSVALVLDKPGGEAASKSLVELAREHDKTFPKVNNDGIIHVLAGAALIQAMETPSTQADAVALGLSTTRSVKSESPILDAARHCALDYIDDRTREVRESGNLSDDLTSMSSLPTYNNTASKLDDLSLNRSTNTSNIRSDIINLADREKELRSSISKLASDLNQLIGLLRKRFDAIASSVSPHLKLEEETDILWWLFGECSRDLDTRFSDLSSTGKPILLGKEAADLTRFVPGHPAIRAILDRALKGSDQEVLRLDEAVTATPFEWREDEWATLKEDLLTPPVLFPVLTATQESLRAGKGGDWSHAFNRATGLDADHTSASLDLALRTHDEVLLLRLVS